MTVGRIRAGQGSEVFLGELRNELRAGRYRPSRGRRQELPKPRQPRKFRPLGILPVADGGVQDAVKNLLEPIFEAHFWLTLMDFAPDEVAPAPSRISAWPAARRRRPKMADALEHPTKGHRGRHQGLFRSSRSPPADGASALKVTRLVGQFLKAGVLEAGLLLPTRNGTPKAE
jgi:RNA-directed DNA polymerase